MLICLIAFLGILTVSVMITPTIRLRSSDKAPSLEMPEDCKYHVFLSHIWSTGQDKAHNIARMTQLLLPGLKIWLDVDNLQDMTQLEKSVKESAIFLLFYSEGYFRSVNCRREIYHAVSQIKPIIIVYEGDWQVVEKDVIAECRLHCTASPGADIIIGQVLAESPILWLGGSMRYFSNESVKLIVSKVLYHLPYYKRYPHQLITEDGLGVLRIGKEQDPTGVTSPLKILSCSNQGALNVAEELVVACKGEVSTCSADIVLTTSGMSPLFEGVKLVLLVYLNQNTFDPQNGNVSDMIERAFDNNIQIVLVHEQDGRIYGCLFSSFFRTTPQHLIDPPYLLYKQSIAIPLYSLDVYRIVSLQQILKNMGARPVSTASNAQLQARNIIREGFHTVQQMSYSLRSRTQGGIHWIRDNLHSLFF